MFPIVKKICERMTKYVDEKIEVGINSFVSKEVTINSYAVGDTTCVYTVSFQ